MRGLKICLDYTYTLFYLKKIEPILSYIISSPWSVFPAQVCALAGDRPNKIWKRRLLIFGLRKYLFRRWNIYLSDWPGGHDNPVKAGLCSNGKDYKYSSVRFYKTGVDDFRFLTHWMK